MYISIIGFAVAFGPIASNVEDFRSRGRTTCDHDERERQTQHLKHINNASHLLLSFFWVFEITMFYIYIYIIFVLSKESVIFINIGSKLDLDSPLQSKDNLGAHKLVYPTLPLASFEYISHLSC